MEEEVKKLKFEIELLKKRISDLEDIERKRKIFKIIKVVVKLFIIIAIVLLIYSWYQQMIDKYESIFRFL